MLSKEQKEKCKITMNLNDFQEIQETSDYYMGTLDRITHGKYVEIIVDTEYLNELEKIDNLIVEFETNNPGSEVDYELVIGMTEEKFDKFKNRKSSKIIFNASKFIKDNFEYFDKEDELSFLESEDIVFEIK